VPVETLRRRVPGDDRAHVELVAQAQRHAVGARRGRPGVPRGREPDDPTDGLRTLHAGLSPLHRGRGDAQLRVLRGWLRDLGVLTAAYGSPGTTLRASPTSCLAQLWDGVVPLRFTATCRNDIDPKVLKLHADRVLLHSRCVV